MFNCGRKVASYLIDCHHDIGLYLNFHHSSYGLYRLFETINKIGLVWVSAYE
jgi:hypothetical protein